MEQEINELCKQLRQRKAESQVLNKRLFKAEVELERHLHLLEKCVECIELISTANKNQDIESQ
jgi:hypothetical protein